MQLVFFGSSDFSVPILEALSSEHHLLAVVTQPDRPRGRSRRPQPTPVKAWARDRGFLVLEPEDLGEVKAELERMHPEAFVVAAYGKILPRWLLDLPPYGAINVHPSLLPRYRGAAPIQWAILKGERETGVTTFLMDEGLDSGPILLQRKVPIGEETASELSRRLSEVGSELILETLRGLQQGRIRPRPQDHRTPVQDSAFGVSHHDIGQHGFAEDKKMQFVKTVAEYARPYITSEGSLPPQFAEYQHIIRGDIYNH